MAPLFQKNPNQFKKLIGSQREEIFTYKFDYNAPRKLYMMTFNHGCDKNKRIANFGESDAAQKFFSRV